MRKKAIGRARSGNYHPSLRKVPGMDRAHRYVRKVPEWMAGLTAPDKAFLRRFFLL